MSEANPVIDRYMTRFEDSLQNYRLSEWKEIAADLRSHIAEAIDYGKPVDEVLQSLGPADVLARAYAVELKMNEPRNTRSGSIGRFFSVLGIVAASGLLTFIVATTLGAIAISFVASGLILIVVGAIEAAGVHFPNVQMAGLSPLLIIAMGPLMMVIGVFSGWGLWRYVRALINVLRRALPRAWTPAL